MSNMISRKAVYDALECMRFASDEERRYGFSLLEQIPTAEPEPNVQDSVKDADCISRTDAIDAISKIKRTDNWQAAVSMALMDLPSAQPERKTGRWVERNPQNSPDCRLIECSECGNAYIVGYNIDYDDWIDGRNFCMKCGADLRGGNNGKST